MSNAKLDTGLTLKPVYLYLCSYYIVCSIAIHRCRGSVRGSAGGGSYDEGLGDG